MITSLGAYSSSAQVSLLSSPRELFLTLSSEFFPLNFFLIYFFSFSQKSSPLLQCALAWNSILTGCSDSDSALPFSPCRLQVTG